ncbi:hypothetical protein HaLaN_00768 [Haematococcus lacustris]|uniref:Uncharacterized protein n=1 Tax=Haematococcus lacustris TaxID=44745 RepID=A0A699YA17_HAELA|nr:hypothetical protein HaLaN_00768 [Haematococcus lacustris]
MAEMAWYNDMVDQLNVEPITSCPDNLARLLYSSPVVTGWPGPLPEKLSSEHSSTAIASSGLGHTSGRSSSNMLGRQEEGVIMDQLISTCKAEAQQLAPLALDLVWGMEGMLQPGGGLVQPAAGKEAERLLSCLMLVLTVMAPLDTWLAAAPSLPAAGAKVSENTSAVRNSLTCMEAEQVWSWQALAAGTPAEASLASVLQGAANKLQLPHLLGNIGAKGGGGSSKKRGSSWAQQPALWPAPWW